MYLYTVFISEWITLHVNPQTVNINPAILYIYNSIETSKLSHVIFWDLQLKKDENFHTDCF